MSSTGKPLMSHYTQAHANEEVARVATFHKKLMHCYQCERCRHWHLAPGSAYEQPRECGTCQGRDGLFKHLYETESDAEQAICRLETTRYVRLRVYECPYEPGFHLTSRY